MPPFLFYQYSSSTHLLCFHMAAIVCHGIQSSTYLESHLVESRIHRLMLPSSKAPPPPQQPIDFDFDFDLSFKSCFAKPQCEGWSSIEGVQKEKESRSSSSSYVHPYQVVRLSPKSLELCTENLGNETGSESAIDNLLSSSECGEGRRREEKRKVREARNFPPPLTTIRGSDSIRVMPHREGGRLVLRLTKVPPCFQAERSPGRLRLCFWTQSQRQDDVVVEDNENENENEVEVEVEGKEDNIEKKEGVDEHEHSTGSNSWSVVRVENKYEMPSRCKEGDHEKNNELLINWVATS